MKQSRHTQFTYRIFMKFEIKGNYFDGKYTLSSINDVENYIERECPADTGLILWKLPIDYSHVSSIMHSANTGYSFWRNLHVDERVSFLKKYQEQLISKKEQIAEAISLESGKPLWEARGEAQSVIGKVDITINDSFPRIEDIEYPEVMPDTTGHIFFKPLGPSLIIGPFNFPCHLANTQILSSLIAGNSIVFKPSERTSYSAQLLIDCFHEAGFPKGVINLIHGDGEVARRLLKEKSIKGVFFTGSKETGLKVLEATYQDLSKLVSLELGGKNPAIVHKDADMELVLEELITGCFLTTGQRCTSTSLVLMHKDVIEDFIPKFHEQAKKIIVDHPIAYENEPLMGPLIDQKSVDNYLNFMGMAKREGIIEIMRGKSLNKATPGHYVSPSIHLAESFNPKSHFLTSEIFGPNCTFIPYTDIDEAIEITNSLEYGLAAAIFTSDNDVYKKCVHNIDTGLLNLNRSTCGASPKLPFGGVKNSGNYHPAAVATIDACVYQMTSLKITNPKKKGLQSIKGLAK